MARPTGPAKAAPKARKSTGGKAPRVELATRPLADTCYDNRPGPSKEEMKAASEPLNCEEDCELDPDEE
ncbi:hypothetical protein RSOL_299130, partial [Rhizoctonia solani AG-3 Rhs1AP]